MKVGQCCHHCLQCHILGGWRGQPHRAGRVRDPSVPVELRRGSQCLLNMKTPKTTCTQPPSPSSTNAQLSPYDKYTWPRWLELCWPVQVKMHVVTKWQSWSLDCRAMGNPARGKES